MYLLPTNLLFMTSQTQSAELLTCYGFDVKHNEYHIIDWKTSRKFDTANTRFPKYMKKPFDHVLYCNTAEYSLQLSLYAYILEKYTSIKISKMILIQIPNKDNPMPQVFRCMDFKNQIKNILEG